MDGPNVNWEVLKKADDMLVKNDYSKTINLGSYPQHTVHGAFETGATNIGMFIKYLKACSGYCMILLLLEIYT